jgi:hypothetical protein
MHGMSSGGLACCVLCAPLVLFSPVRCNFHTVREGIFISQHLHREFFRCGFIIWPHRKESTPFIACGTCIKKEPRSAGEFRISDSLAACPVPRAVLAPISSGRLSSHRRLGQTKSGRRHFLIKNEFESLNVEQDRTSLASGIAVLVRRS